jgi:uncharacterized protein YbbC (DUF1343 family)
MHTRFLPGIEVLTKAKKNWLKGRRMGLVSHPAAVDTNGTPSWRVLLNSGAKLTAFFGPEHGFFGKAKAGQPLRNIVHPLLKIPVYSLYGQRRKPTPAMLDKIDTLIFDVQDLGARPYTYVSTLRYLLEAAAQAQKEVIVADRPIPLPCIVDGPMLDEKFSSFVGCIPAPMHYGMTPGETALWLKHHLALDIDLKIAEMRGYRRQSKREADWPPWIPPSPGIRSWETGYCYLATVFGEALPAVNIGRNSNLVFQVFSAAGIKSDILCKYLNRQKLRGVLFFSQPYKTENNAKVHDGVRISVHNPDIFHPVKTGIAILSAIQKFAGPDFIWRFPGTRADFFDKLYGTERVRLALQRGAMEQSISRTWQKDITAFKTTRKKFMLYYVNL